MLHRTNRAAQVAALALSLALAACGGGGDTEAGSPTPTPTQTPTPTPSPSPTPSPATYTVGVNVNAVGTGETFTFSLGAQTLNVTQGGTAVNFGTALAANSTYTVNQTAGPRTCTLSSNRTGTITANVVVTANCATPPGSSTLKGEFRGPIGASVVLRTAFGDTVTATVPPLANSIDRYNAVTFEFPTTRPDGTAYTLSLQSVPAGQTCRVYKGATGTLPVADTAVKVGCEVDVGIATRNTAGTVFGTFFESTNPVIGGSTQYGEGRFVAFMSSANLGGNSAGRRQIWWHDRLDGTTLLISTDSSGNPGNGDSFAPAISEDGLTVVFESNATNLVAGDTNGVRDVFMWSAAGGTIPTGVRRVSVGAGGVEANSESYGPSVNADGSVVAFSSGASNLAAGVSGIGTINAYRRDVRTGTNTLLSLGTNGQGVGGDRTAISGDGNRVAFWSFAANIASGDTNGLWDIFVYEHSSGTRKRVSVTSTGGERNQGSESSSRVVSPSISADGRFVAYATTATNVVPGDTNGLQDVFVVNVDTLAVQRVSTATGGAQADADAPNGQGEKPAISRDGTWIAYTSAATNLGNGTTTTGIGNVYLTNRVTGQTTSVSNQRSIGSAGVPTISYNGAYVAFGASTPLDPLVASSGLFVRFTDQARAWFWID